MYAQSWQLHLRDAPAVAFASLSLGSSRASGDDTHPTCAHDHDLHQLFQEFDKGKKGFLDAHTMQVGTLHYPPSRLAGACTLATS